MLSLHQKFKDNLLNLLGFNPTLDQNILIDQLSTFVFSENLNEIFVLKGYAGTGKTSVLSALTQTLPLFKTKSVLLAPTGRAAKVLSLYSKKKAFTIHRKIYKRSLSPEGGIQFGLDENKHKNTLFIIDEASMIGDDSNSSNEVYRNNLLNDLIEYVFSGDNCKIIFSGDTAQLPPVGTTLSPALNSDYLKSKYYFNVRSCELKQVVRQSEQSGILFNATSLRVQLLSQPKFFPNLTEYTDIKKIGGDELEDALNSAYSTYGEENVLIITRSNKRAVQFNQQIRTRIKYQENIVSAGDLMMVVKNNYTWLEEKSIAGFIANGDALQIQKVTNIKEMYGMQFASAVLRMIDYPDEPDFEATLNLSILNSDLANMPFGEQRKFARLVLEDIGLDAPRFAQMQYLKENTYYNALQVKFSYAVTCHKSQGGQWPCIFIDKGYITEEMIGEDYYRWLYTAITRATEIVYLVNF